jgi:hypothetical protein
MGFLSHQPAVTSMWNLNSKDVQHAKELATLRRTEIEARHAQELEALNTELSDIETLERIAAEFALKHKATDAETASPTPPAASPVPPAAEPPASGGKEGKLGSRWRFQLAGNPTETEDAHGDPAA